MTLLLTLLILILSFPGEAPFGNTESMSRYEVFNRITEKSPPYPFFMSFNLKSLIKGLLEKDSTKRWAYDQVAACPWMKDVSIDPWCSRINFI